MGFLVVDRFVWKKKFVETLMLDGGYKLDQARWVADYELWCLSNQGVDFRKINPVAYAMETKDIPF